MAMLLFIIGSVSLFFGLMGIVEKVLIKKGIIHGDVAQK